MPLTNMLMVQSVMISSAMLNGLSFALPRRRISKISEYRRYVPDPNFYILLIQSFFKLLIF